ncbi:hypothetical protein T265_16218, partial [Opisthorchis viverrini]
VSNFTSAPKFGTILRQFRCDRLNNVHHNNNREYNVTWYWPGYFKATWIRRRLFGGIKASHFCSVCIRR